MVDPQLARAFRKAREHQKSLWGTGGMLTVFPSGRTERTFASAPFGEHAISAFTGARRSIHFLGTMTADAAARERRSKAAKKAAQKRRDSN